MTFAQALAAAGAALALAVAAPAARAAVTYDFTALSSLPIGGETFTGAFSVTLPGFVTADTDLALATLGRCSVTASGGGAQCAPEQIKFEVIPGQAVIAMGLTSALNPHGAQVFYYFDAADLAHDGVYASDILDARQAGTLTVSGAPGVSAVPEPASMALAIAGLGALGLAARRRRTGR